MAKELVINECSLKGQKANVHLSGALINTITFPFAQDKQKARIKRVISNDIYLMKAEGYQYNIDGKPMYSPTVYIIAQITNGIVQEAYECTCGMKSEDGVLQLVRKLVNDKIAA